MMTPEEDFKEGLIAESSGRLLDAIELYKRAFAAGHLVSGYRLGICDRRGPEIMARSEALKWLEAASGQGHAIATALFARAVFRSEVPGGLTKGVYLLTKALALMVGAIWRAPPGMKYEEIPQLRKW